MIALATHGPRPSRQRERSDQRLKWAELGMDLREIIQITRQVAESTVSHQTRKDLVNRCPRRQVPEVTHRSAFGAADKKKSS